HAHHGHVPSFPTRRSSDLVAANQFRIALAQRLPVGLRTEPHHAERLPLAGRKPGHVLPPRRALADVGRPRADGVERIVEVRPARDRKSTRLNSSHVKISYA